MRLLDGSARVLKPLRSEGFATAPRVVQSYAEHGEVVLADDGSLALLLGAGWNANGPISVPL